MHTQITSLTAKLAPLAPLALAILIAITQSGCAKHKDTTPAAAPLRSVTAASVLLQPQAAQNLVATPGNVVAVESVKVASRLMGHIRTIAVVEGQSVRAGQRLFTIDPIDVEGGVEQARLGLKQAEDTMQDAKADYDRFDTLYKEDVVTRQNYEKMKLNYEMAITRLAQARAGLDTARGQLRYATVTSPIDGVVTQKLANEGDIAAPGHPVIVVENMAHLHIQTSVDERVFKTLNLGDTVSVEVDGHAGALTAKVARISPAADPMTHTYLVKLDVTAATLKSGRFARVQFPVGQRLVLAIPKAAVQDRAGITGVFVLDEQGIAGYRMVRLGAEQNGQIEVLSGLAAGDRVATENAARLNNGDRVTAPDAAPATPATAAKP